MFDKSVWLNPVVQVRYSTAHKVFIVNIGDYTSPQIPAETWEMAQRGAREFTSAFID